MIPTETAASPRTMPRFAEFVAMMALLMALTALSIDVMLPALPLIRDEYGLADPNRMQLVVTAYVVGFAAGQLFHGPLSDWLGRKPVLLVGLAVYALASVGCLLAGSFEGLLAARVVQGLANAAPRVIAVAVVRDVYGGRRMAEVMSFVMVVFIIVPVLAPSVGGAFLLVGSWHLIFAFLAATAIGALAWLGLRLPETRDASEIGAMSLGWVARAYATAASNRLTLGYTLATGAVFSALMGYINSAQQVFVEVYRLGAWFPMAFGGVALGVALASFVNGRIVQRVGMRPISHWALVGFVATSLVHLSIDVFVGTPPLAVFVLLLAISLFCFGLLMPNFNAMAMEPMGRIAGTASSFIGALTTGVAAFGGYWIGRAYDGTATPLLAGFAAGGVLSLVLVLVTERGRLFQSVSR
jgi:DHA1 family bicyclomycin/chloramphenicol resistance-like MFS transporter